MLRKGMVLAIAGGAPEFMMVEYFALGSGGVAKTCAFCLGVELVRDRSSASCYRSMEADAFIAAPLSCVRAAVPFFRKADGGLVPVPPKTDL